MRRWLGPFLLGLVLAAAGCSQDAERSGGAPTRAGDVERGRRLYLANCIACHNTDPTKPGPVGPAIAGSSRELVEARVLHAAYPPGYTPKRSSNVMPPLPHLAAAVPDIAAYLGSLPAD
jgi:mono/diheme cytochrome c family protein